MKRLTIALAITTITFASTTAYFMHALSVERARVPIESTAKGARVPVESASTTAPSKPVSTGPAVAANTEPAVKRDAANSTSTFIPVNRAELAAVQKDLMDRLADPAKRAEMIALQKTQLRAETREMAKRVGLTQEELERFLDLLAEQTLQGQQRFLTCRADPNCKLNPAEIFDRATAEQQMVQVLGQDKFDRYKAFQESAPQRMQVGQFRLRLPDGAGISDEQGERLVAVLAEEKRQFEEAATQAGAKVSSLFTMGGEIRYIDLPDAADSSERKLDSATEYSRQLRDRAAGFLNPTQLATFNEMQDEALSQLRERLRVEETVKSVRQSGSR